MAELSPNSVPRIDSVHSIQGIGPWVTKSGGKLDVLVSIPFDQINNQYLKYDASEIQALERDIRGLRLYIVRDIQKNRIGGNEWHRIRSELVFTLKGSILWECEDLYGHKKEIKIDRDSGLFIPPFILHTYKAEESDSTLIAMANTLFVTDDPQTFDTYSSETFRGLQAQY